MTRTSRLLVASFLTITSITIAGMLSVSPRPVSAKATKSTISNQRFRQTPPMFPRKGVPIVSLALAFNIPSEGQVGPEARQAQDSQSADASTRRIRIAEIMRKTIKSGEGQIIVNGQVVHTYTRKGPTTGDVEEVKRYGDDAVPILSEYLSSSDAREYQLAMHLLGALGGRRIIGPLRNVIFMDPSSTKREYAIRAITQAPWDEASEILRHAAASDPSREVRKVAREMLKGYEQ